MKVPFVDLRAQYQTIRQEIDSAIAQVIDQTAFIRGPFVEEFERRYAAVMGTPHCISCGNGTDSLYIALKALGVGPEQEVITTAHSWIATSETITQAGGRVRFVDTDNETFTINPQLIEPTITSRTTGIVVVHLYGQPADMRPIMAVARQHRLWVVEDCAQAHLAHYQGRLVGTFGDAGTFSFYPGKNLGAYGDAGCIVTSNDSLARHMTMFARHGGTQKGEHEIEGINSRMDGIQAAILTVKLKQLSRWTEDRRHIAAVYDRELAGVGDVVTPEIAEGREHVYHLYVIRTVKRDALRQWLQARGVATGVNYPVALPFLRAYVYLGYRPEDFPMAYANQSRILSLPIFPEMTEAQIHYVVEQIRAFYRR
jgi:dTDP-4-amino-4,6-dideoxygalactose transaminase